MSLNIKTCIDQLKYYPKADECLRQSKSSIDALPSYNYLLELRNEIPKELYSFYLRKLLLFNTANVSVELRLKMLDGVARDDIMFQEELDALHNFDENVTIYRGTSKNEREPGLSWSIKRYVAESSDFYRGRLYIATIPTSSILFYFSKNTAEEEIIAHVIDNYTIVDDPDFSC